MSTKTWNRTLCKPVKKIGSIIWQQKRFNLNCKSVSPQSPTYEMDLLFHLKEFWAYVRIKKPVNTILTILEFFPRERGLNESKQTNIIIHSRLWILEHVLEVVLIVLLFKEKYFCNVIITLNWKAINIFVIHNCSRHTYFKFNQ